MKKTIILAIAGLAGTEIVWQLWRFYVSRKRIAEEIERNEDLLVEVLEFSQRSNQCRDHAITRIPCDNPACPVANVRKLCWYLRSPSKSLDVCIYMVTCDDLTEAIISTHRRNIRVRVIVDAGMGENSACNNQLTRMRRAGIEVRMNELRPSSLMHHKFAIVDDKIAILGSTNWTMQAFYGNYDGIVITNVRQCVESYSTMFEAMWLEFGNVDMNNF